MTEVDTALFVGAVDSTKDARFDEATHTWTIGGRRARVIISSDGALPAQFVRTDSLIPYLGVAVHGIPNYFMITGPEITAQKAYIAKCLEHLNRTDSTRIEVSRHAQRAFDARCGRWARYRGHVWRRAARLIPSAFDVTSLEDERQADSDVYDGPATVRVEGENQDARVRLMGHIDPIDGHYHWQGTLFDIDLGARQPQSVVVAIGDRTATARLTERGPSSTYSLVGVGAPPFELGRVEVEVPLL